MSLIPYNNKRTVNKSKGHRRPQAAVPVSVRPPQVMPNPVNNRRVRYGCTTTGTYNITSRTAAFTLGGMCTGASTAYSLVTAFRIKRIQVWGVAAQSGTTSLVTITWFGDQSLQFMSNREIMDNSTSTAYVPYVNARPPARSSAAEWHAVQGSSYTSDVLFSITCNQGGVIDIEYEYVQADGNASPTASLSISGGVAGAIRYGPLDGYGGGYIPTEGVTAF
jgi:hypothetical protein